MAGVAGIGKLGWPAGKARRSEREASARRWGNKLFIPALAIPVLTIIGTFVVFNRLSVNGALVVAPKDVTLVSLGVGTLGALIIGMIMLRPRPSVPIVEARRLLDSVGWAAVLPQTLAALGAVFAVAGVGKIVATLADRCLPLGTPLAAVIAYTVGMAVLTALMGNAFAAFPVMTAGIALPLIVQRFGGNVTIVAAVGMLAAYSGTLWTPMAANFNIVPARLLELPDDNAVIRVQIPTALMLLVVNIAIMYLFAYPMSSGRSAVARPRDALRDDRARPRHARVPEQARSCSERRERPAESARAPSDLLRKLRLAFVRARVLVAGDENRFSLKLLFKRNTRAVRSPVDRGTSRASSVSHAPMRARVPSDRTGGRGSSCSRRSYRAALDFARRRGTARSLRSPTPSSNASRPFSRRPHIHPDGTHTSSAFATTLALEYADTRLRIRLSARSSASTRCAGTPPTRIVRRGSRVATTSCRRR